MALKPDFNPIADDISFFCNDTTADRGGIVCISTVGSGVAMDQAQALVTYSVDASGKAPLGILMQDIVNVDLTRQHINWYKPEVQTGSKVWVLTNGTVVTDRIYPGTTPSAGSAAYVHHSGYLTPTKGSSGNTPLVGKFLSSKDEAGFAKVMVNLPTALL